MESVGQLLGAAPCRVTGPKLEVRVKRLDYSIQKGQIRGEILTVMPSVLGTEGSLKFGCYRQRSVWYPRPLSLP